MVNPCSARYYDQNMQCTFIGFVDYMCLSPRLVAYFPSQWTHIVDAARVGILKVNLHTGIPTAQRKVMVMLGLPLQNQHNFGYLRILIRWSKDISRDLCYLQQLWKHGGQDLSSFFSSRCHGRNWLCFKRVDPSIAKLSSCPGMHSDFMKLNIFSQADDRMSQNMVTFHQCHSHVYDDTN